MPHFLTPLLTSAPQGWVLRNERTGLTVSAVLLPAFDSRSRRRGLLGETGLQRDAAVILAPCSAIHTWFMRFSIDVMFVQKNGTVRKVFPSLPPWRIAVDLRSFAAIELAAGIALETGTRSGDRLSLASADPVCS